MRHTLRRITRSPGSAVVVLITLAVGIGAATAIFSVVKTILLEPLPYPNSDQLVRILDTVVAEESPRGIASEEHLVEVRRFLQWRASTNTLSQMAAYVSFPATITTAEGAARAVVARVSPAIFPMLGARMTLGRPLLDADERSAMAVVVVSLDAWRAWFGASADVVGRTVVLDGVGHTVVGVAPDGFDFPSRQTQFWVTFVHQPPPDGGERFVNVVARMRHDVSFEEASAEAAAIGRLRVQRLHGHMTASVAPALHLFMVAALVVMLIATVNVLTLLLSRSTRHREEMLVQQALGASRGCLIGQVMIEALTLGCGGAVIGLALAYAGVELLKEMARVEIPELFQLAAAQRFGTGSVFPRVDEIGIDVGSLAFASGIAVLAGVIAGLGPALQIIADERRPVSSGSSLNRSAATSTSGGGWIRNVLVFAQVVLATALLVAAVLLVRSFAVMTRVPMGYDVSNVLSFQLVVPQEHTASRKAALAHELASRLGTLPGVEAAGFSSLPPLAGGAFAYGVFQPPGKTVQEMLRDPAAPQARSVSRDYLRAMSVRLLEGRWFGDADGVGDEQVLLVTRSVARRHFGMRSAIGARVRLAPAPRPWTIVGVVDDIHNGMPWEEPYPQFFMDPRQALLAMPHLPERMRETAALGFLSYAVRVNGEPAGIMPEIRAVLRQLDPTAALDDVMPLSDIVSGRMSRPRFYAVWSALLAVVAAVLGIIGVYATVSYAMTQRTREIGIRIALGAQRSAVLRLILSHGMTLAASGVAIGLGGALLLSRYLASMLHGVTPADPLAYGVAGLLFFGVAAAASYLPAHRATRVDPLTAIRHE